MKKMVQCMLLLTGMNMMGQTQLELNDAETKKYAAADKELNRVYQKILTEYKTDTTFIKNLKITQRIWMQFRDAEIKMKYPDRPDGYYGSIAPMCWSIYLTQLTTTRTKTLQEWLKGTEEGDVCGGSQKVK